MKIAVIQMNSTNNKGKNIVKAKEFIDEASNKGAKLIALPEMFNFLGPNKEKLSQSETIPGPTIKCMMNKAIEHKIYILCGSILEKSKDCRKAFNTSVFLNPQGAIIAKYRKIHLFDIKIKGESFYRESATMNSGTKVVTISTDFAKLGFSICYDLRFPELYRKLTIQGAQIIFIPAAFTLQTGKDHWEVLIRARAIENQVYIIAPAQTGSHPPGEKCYGKSMIVDPWGIVIAKASDKEMIIYSEIDLLYQNKVRKEIPSLSHIRKDIFPI